MNAACGGSRETATVPEAPIPAEPRDPRLIAERQTEKMTTELGLTAEQTEQVGAINRRYAERGQQLRQQAGGDRRATMQAARTLQTERNAELKAVLTAAQFTQLEKMQARERERRRARMRQRRGGGGRPGAFH